MSYDHLHRYTVGSISIREAALVLAGTEPKLCYIDLSNNFGRFNPGTNDLKEAARRCAAKDYYNLLMLELAAPESQLSVTYLIASLLKKKACAEKEQEIPPELEALIRNDDVLVIDKGETSQFYIQSPSKSLKDSLIAGPWFISEETAITADSVEKWAKSKGVQSVFSERSTPLPSREDGFISATILDAPKLIDALLRLDHPYISKTFAAALAVLKHVIIHGTGRRPLNDAVTQFLAKSSFNLGSKAKLVPKVLNLWKTKPEKLTPFEDFIKSGSKIP